MKKLKTGFISLVTLLWFSALLAFLSSSLLIIKHYTITLANLETLNKESFIELKVISKTRQMWSDFDEENYCEWIGDYEVCWVFHQEKAQVTIDYQESIKTLDIEYNSDCDCIKRITRKVDK